MFNRITHLSICLLILFNVFSAYSQEILQKNEAVKIAMENNFDIQISYNNMAAAENNASIENSNYLPSVSGTAGANYSNSNGTIIQKSGEKQTISNNETTGLNASIGFQYTIFDGFGRSNTYKILQENYNISQLEARLMVENTILNIFNSYYDVARLTQDVANQKETMDISRTRLQRARYNLEYGQGSQLDILNAEVDYNNDSITYLTNTQALANEKRTLNLYLGRDINIIFTVDTSLSYADDLYLEALLARSLENNATLLQQQSALNNAEYNVKSTTANMIPKLNVNGGYGWSKNILGISSILDESVGIGPNLGATLNWNIYDGGSTRVRRQNAKIAVQNQSIFLKKERLNIERNLSNAYTAYQTALFVKDAQQKNLETAQVNFERSVDTYKLGQITSIVFRQAQLNLLQAKLSLNQAKYSAKIAELFLLQISGDLSQATF